MALLCRLQGFARRLRPALPVLSALAALLFVVAAYLAVFGDPQRSDVVLLPAIVGFLWCFCAVVLIGTFASVPPPVTAQMTGWARFKRRLARGWYGVLALAFLGLTVATLLLSNRLLGEVLA
ncbi:hypothetical protein [uncultured Thiohalocapsa sp.]|uniref:hypothetical protein n=1 Tax=uncultured Thiohalocapsa sp. TaxID=768990 RepID=UPI0025DBF407|nr:hypothetical protein [uncultured Thiohalocapsa sp.]